MGGSGISKRFVPHPHDVRVTANVVGSVDIAVGIVAAASRLLLFALFEFGILAACCWYESGSIERIVSFCSRRLLATTPCFKITRSLHISRFCNLRAPFLSFTFVLLFVLFFFSFCSSPITLLPRTTLRIFRPSLASGLVTLPRPLLARSRG